eukprot:3767992-Heterocapsa_arctica.AAC.1
MKGKTKTTTTFDGMCNRCGRRGHAARDCRAVMAVEDEGVLNIDVMAEVIDVKALTTDNGMLLLVDSGACISTCPRNWCDWAPTSSSNALPHAVTATGKALQMYGLRRVRCTTWDNESFDLTFVVSDVNRPIVAVRDLLDQGFVPDFRHPAGLVRFGRRLPLVMAGVLYYLP